MAAIKLVLVQMTNVLLVMQSKRAETGIQQVQDTEMQRETKLKCPHSVTDAPNLFLFGKVAVSTTRVVVETLSTEHPCANILLL